MKYLIAFLALFSTIFLSSCSSNSEPNAYLNVTAAHYLNPDMNGRASPLVLTVYQLKSPFSFRQASYNALVSNSAKVLGSNLLDKSVFEIRPGQAKTLEVSLSPNTKYLGIVAAYRDIDRASTWHYAVQIAANQTINVNLESQNLTVSRGGQHKFLDFKL